MEGTYQKQRNGKSQEQKRGGAGCQVPHKFSFFRGRVGCLQGGQQDARGSSCVHTVLSCTGGDGVFRVLGLRALSHNNFSRL